MIKTSNLRTKMLLGLGGVGALGLGGLVGAEYGDNPERFHRLVGIVPYRDTPAAAAARAEREAIWAAQALERGTRTGRQMSKIMGDVLSDASFGVFGPDPALSIKTSSRSRALKALGAVAGLGALGVGGLALGAPVALNSLMDHVYNQTDEGFNLFRQPIYLDAANPFRSINNIRRRAVAANSAGNDIYAVPPGTSFFDSANNQVNALYGKANFALGQGYLQNDYGGLRRRLGMPLASFEYIYPR